MIRYSPHLWLTLVVFVFLATSLITLADDSKASNCPLYAQKPENFTFLVAGEKWCPMKFLHETCYTCCQKTDTVCCDDGTCMDYDPYCRYPKSCCTAAYCDDRCCPASYGTPCGPVCAPSATTQCCNTATGQLCAKSDPCCNDFCCPPSTFCCSTANKCLEQGETCCGTTSCDANSFCCGNIANQCCPHGYDCLATGGCCPSGNECPGVPAKCCGEGSKCCGDHCCPSDQNCCGNTCCTQGHTCCDGKCCSSDIGCQSNHECCPQPQVCGETCCPAGQTCCDDHHCCPPGNQCCGDKCCPTDRSCCRSEHDVCRPSGFIECTDRCCLSGTTCINDRWGVQCCDGQYCGSTGRCCHPGTVCNERGHCCNSNTKFCPGGGAEACFPLESTCCGDGTACPSSYPVCLVQGGTTGTPVCCPFGMDAMCGGICIPRDYRNCACCGISCCYSPYSCDGNGRCFHDYDTGNWWSGHHHHHDEQPNDGKGVPAIARQKSSKLDLSQYFLYQVLPVEKIQKPKATNETHPPIQLPPPPSRVYDPASYPCFQDKNTMNDTCTAWDCLEQITNCGLKGPIQDRYQLICKDFRELSNLFNPIGQVFLNCTANCVTAEIVSVFRDEDIKPCCASLVLWQNDQARFQCWKDCGFCSAYMTNHFGFKAIFDKADPGNDPNNIYNTFCPLG